MKKLKQRTSVKTAWMKRYTKRATQYNQNEQLSKNSHMQEVEISRIRWTNFWIMKLSSSHDHLAFSFNRLLNEEEDTHLWLTKEKTHFILKNDETMDQKNLPK